MKRGFSRELIFSVNSSSCFIVIFEIVCEFASSKNLKSKLLDGL